MSDLTINISIPLDGLQGITGQTHGNEKITLSEANLSFNGTTITHPNFSGKSITHVIYDKCTVIATDFYQTDNRLDFSGQVFEEGKNLVFCF